MGLEPKRPIIAVQIRSAGRLPGPVANTIQASQEHADGLLACNWMALTVLGSRLIAGRER